MAKGEKRVKPVKMSDVPNSELPPGVTRLSAYGQCVQCCRIEPVNKDGVCRWCWVGSAGW